MFQRCTHTLRSSHSSKSTSISPLTPSSLIQWFQQCHLFFPTTSRLMSTSTSSSPSSHAIQRRHYAHYHRTYTSLNHIFASQIAEYARRPQRGVTLQEMIKVGQQPSQDDILKNAVFLYKELPIRLAKKVKELESLPYGLSLTKPVQKVKGWYEQSFRDILALPVPQTVNDDQQFTATLERILDRHANVVPTMAMGVLQMKKDMGANGDDIIDTCPFLHDFLNRFYTSRIGIRMLISQHVSLHHPRADYIGNIATNLSPVACARAAVQDAAHICDKTYGAAPEVTITGNENQTIHYVPSHLNYILFELLKNSMRAVIEFHGTQNPPPIDIVIIEDDQDFAIKISDAGGGMTRKEMSRIWSYMHTTANKNVADLLDQLDTSSPPPMAGFGYGLPISRLYARYFGGDLQLISMHGYGTDAYVYLHKLGENNLFLD